jgi:hypothetical protein
MKPLITFGLAAVAGMASASESFLISIPVADVLGHREAYAMVYAYGYERNVNRGGYDWGQGFEVGLFDRLEFGYDNDLRGGTELNVKFQFAHGANWAISAGIDGATPGAKTANHYVVGRFDAGTLHFHAGLMRNDRNRLLLGIEGDLKEGWSWMADFTSGPGSYAWVGLNAPVGPLWLTLAAGIPGNRADGVQHMISAMYYFKL